MDVFTAFPHAINNTDWELGEIKFSTAVGNEYAKIKTLSVIVDEANGAKENQSPNVANLDADVLLYVKPDQLPTTNINRLVASYGIKNTTTDEYYQIVSVGIGRNQENNRIEHIELKLLPTTMVTA